MPNFPRSARGDVPPLGDAAFEALLAGNLPPEQAADGLRPVAEVIAALSLAPARSEIAAEARAREAYRAAFSRPAPHAPRRRRHPVLASLLSAQLAAAAVLILGAIAAAAWVGVLPAPVQRLAHDVFGAPAARHSAPAQHPAAATDPNATSPTPTGPPATGPDAHGLCTAYWHAQAHGNASQKSVAFRNLAAAAGGAANITAYCAGVPHPGSTPPGKTNPGNAHRGASPPGKPASPPGGQPSAHPSRSGNAQHTGQPATSRG
jgi:hypothetical protein